MNLGIHSKLHEFPADTKQIYVVGDLHGDFKSFDLAVHYWQQKKDSNLLQPD